jgi:hypothetical protein
MGKKLLDYKDVENMSEEELKKVKEFSLIDYNVHIRTLVENKDGQAFSHLVYVPSVFLKDIDTLECVLEYPLHEKHTFQISVEKTDYGKMCLLDVDALLCAIADEYKMLWNEHEDLFWGHSWGELWIEELILKGNTLELFVGS